MSNAVTVWCLFP